MILYPVPVLGFNPVYKGPVNFFAYGQRLTFPGGTAKLSQDARVSPDGQRYIERGLSGDIAGYKDAADGMPGAFQASAYVWTGSVHVIVGSIYDAAGDQSCAIFTSPDLRKWTEQDAGIAGDKRLVGVAFGNGAIAALSNDGDVTVSDASAASWENQGNIGFTGTGSFVASAIAASDTHFVAGGRDGQLFTATDPAGTWTARNSGFGTERVDKLVAGSVFVAMGRNIIRTSPADNPVTWTSRNHPVAGELVTLTLVYESGRYFAGLGGNNWITSINGTSWSEPADKPWGEQFGSAQAIFFDGSSWYCIWRGSGDVIRVSVSDDASTWTEVSEAGLLTDFDYPIGTYVGA